MEIEKREIGEETLRKILSQIIDKVSINNMTKKFITKKNTIDNFMYVNHYDIDKSIEHLIKSIEWRSDNITVIDNLNDYCKDHNIMDNIAVLSKLNKNYVLYCNLQSDLPIEKIFNYLFSIIEHILINTDCEQYILIFDCQGIGLEYSFYLPSILNQIKLLKEHFPERLKNLLLYNTSQIISKIYDGIKIILDNRIQKKVVFIKDSAEIANYCSQTVLETILNNKKQNITI